MTASVSAIDQASKRRKASSIDSAASPTLRAFNAWVDGIRSPSLKLIVKIEMGRNVAETIDGETSGRDMASNTKRLNEIMDEIETELARQVESDKQVKATDGQGVKAFDPTSVT